MGEEGTRLERKTGKVNEGEGEDEPSRPIASRDIEPPSYRQEDR
jgi:hypothetical protein